MNNVASAGIFSGFKIRRSGLLKSYKEKSFIYNFVLLLQVNYAQRSFLRFLGVLFPPKAGWLR